MKSKKYTSEEKIGRPQRVWRMKNFTDSNKSAFELISQSFLCGHRCAKLLRR